METKKELPQLLTLKQASQILNCHANTLRLWEKRGLVKPIRLGVRGDRKYLKDDIMALLGEKKMEVGVRAWEGIDEFKQLFDDIVELLIKKDFYWVFAFNIEYFDKQVRKILSATHKKLAEKKVEDKEICSKDVLAAVKRTFNSLSNNSLTTK